jgi:dolichol-phosphate mannosyltransferase
LTISVVVPVLNEEPNIRPLYERLRDVFGGIGCDFELLFVDDGSRDGTCDQIRALHAEDSRVRLLSFSRNFGHQVAITAGMDHAVGDAVVVMDADFQHPPETIVEFVRWWREGYDIVYSVRESNESAGFLKNLTSRGFYRVFRFFSGVEMEPNAADFRLLDRKVVLAFRQIRERTRFLRGLTAWVGFRSRAVKYQAAGRQAGTTKYTPRKMLQLAGRGILSFSTVPLRMAIYLGFALAGLGFLYGLSAVWDWWRGDVVPGWTSTLVVISLVGGIQLIVLGVLGLYIGKIYEELKQRPLYLLSESLGVEGVDVGAGQRAPDSRPSDVSAGPRSS